MCMQCLTKSKTIVDDPIPGYFLVQATVGIEEWPEGYRKTQNQISICNSNSNIMVLSQLIFRKLSEKNIEYQLQIHKDNDEGEEKSYWATVMGINPDFIRIIRKSNSGELGRRQWRSVHGVLSIRIHDTYARCRVQALMDAVEKDWSKRGVNLPGVA